MMPRAATALALGLVACGTVASPGGGEVDLPNNRTGPFRELSYDEMGSRCTAIDFTGVFDEPTVVRMANQSVVLYGSHVRGDRSTIARAPLRTLGRAGSDPEDVFTATLPWQGAGVSSPDVAALPGGGYVMAYATASGAIGLARSADGLVWQPSAAAALQPDASQGEETGLRAPTVVLGAQGVTLVYASAGSLWLARAPGLDGPFTRVDANPGTARRDPLLGASGAVAGRDGGAPDFESGALDDPELTVEASAAGRSVWRLYYTARSVPTAMDGGVRPTVSVAMAASFDGTTFVRYGAPIVVSRTDPTLSAPAVLDEGPRRTMLYMGGRCDSAGRLRGVRGAIAPGTERLPTVQ